MVIQLLRAVERHVVPSQQPGHADLQIGFSTRTPAHINALRAALPTDHKRQADEKED